MIYEGTLSAKDLKLAIIVGRFNSMVTESLLSGAEDAIRRHGGDLDATDIVYVPGAYEIPLTAQVLAKKNHYDAIICLGAVIKGATDHYEHVAGEAAKGIAHVSLNENVPVIFGVLTTQTTEQALERAGLKAGNKGYEAAMAAIEMASVLSTIS
jgi:6,7-dimethyl-8-ribityllumazine synthase